MNTENQTLSQRGLDARQEHFFQAHGLGTLLLRPAERLVHPYAWTGHIPFAQALICIMRPKVFVELGTHSGNSFCAFCQAIRDEKLGTYSYAVDTWGGDDQAGYYDDAVFNDLAPYVHAAYSRFAKLLRMTFNEGLSQFDDGSIDLLHIDGLHTYEAVRHDFEAWKGKLSPRGVVLFHDTQVFDRDFGVYRLWAELREEYCGFEFLHSHGLGILLVGTEVAPAVVEFINLAIENPDPIQSLFERASQVWLPGEAIAYQRRYASEHSAEAVSLDCELYLDYGQGFSETEKLISLLRLEQCKGMVQYELGHFSDRLLGLRFDPGSEAIALHSISAWGRSAAGGWDELDMIRNSAIGSDQDTMLFAADPWVEFALPSTGIEAIKIELQMKAMGTELVELLIEFAKRVVGLEAELATHEASARKLWSDLAEKEAELAAHEASARKLWSDLAEKEAELAAHEASAKKLWSDLAEKDREATQCKQSLEVARTIVQRVGSHPMYRLLFRFRLVPPISLN